MTDHERHFERIEEYLDDALPPGEREAFADHVRSCPECRAEIDAHRRLVRLASAAEPVRVPDDLSARIRERIESVAPRPRSRLLRPLLWAAASVAAALLLAAVIPWEEPVRPATPEPPPTVVAAVPGVEPAPARLTREALSDWLDQARNAAPDDAPFLAEEARVLDLLPGVRAALADAHGAERRYLLAAEDVLIQLLNDPSPGDLAPEARAVAQARSR